MPKSNLSATAISSAPDAEHDASIGSNTAQNHGKPGETVFAGEKELLALRRWLEQEPSKSTSWQVVRALVDESLKKVSLSGNLKRFTDEELRDAAGLEDFDWRDVRTWWVKRRDDARTFLAGDDQDGALLDLERFRGGGRGIKASTGIVVSRLGGASADQGGNEDEDSGTSGPVRYTSRNSKPIRLSGPWRRWLFSSGEIKVGSTRHAILRWRVMTSALLLLLIGLVFISDLVVRNRPIETQNLAYLFGIVIIGKLWWQEWRPIYHARLDRITALPEEWLKDDELPAQLERKRTGPGEVLRLVRYRAVCPTCGADVHLGEGMRVPPAPCYRTAEGQYENAKMADGRLSRTLAATMLNCAGQDSTMSRKIPASGAASVVVHKREIRGGSFRAIVRQTRKGRAATIGQGSPASTGRRVVRRRESAELVRGCVG